MPPGEELRWHSEVHRLNLAGLQLGRLAEGGICTGLSRPAQGVGRVGGRQMWRVGE